MTGCIKQIAAGRRKPNMTRKEYFDHRFRIHGSLSDGTENKDDKPQYVNLNFLLILSNPFRQDALVLFRRV